jgi:hypothetical protein
MSMTKNKVEWECISNHLPDWIEENDDALFACMTKEERERILIIINRYNELSEREESNDEDGYSLYGVEDEKADLVKEFVSVNEKYKDAATSSNQ